jgi:endonuclease/exonuclease/phosphatase family metal-dependent hydrolase
MYPTNRPVFFVLLFGLLAGCSPMDKEAGLDISSGADTDIPSRPDADTSPARDAGADSDAAGASDAADAPDSDEPNDPDALRLATWNVSFLDVPGGSDEAPRTEADYDLLRTYVARLDADVVALQEVRGAAGAHTIFPADSWTAECEARDSPQNVCVLTRNESGWQLTRNTDLISLNVGNPSLRHGLDITISKPGYAPLRVLAIHLKSGCFFGDDGPDCNTFFQQVAEVETWVDSRAAAGETYAVLGDFNRFLTADDAAWLELDDGEPAGADITRSIPQGTPTPCWSELFTEFIDHILLDPNSASWLVDSGQNPYDETDFDAYYLRLSDHCPLWADLRVPPSD